MRKSLSITSLVASSGDRLPFTRRVSKPCKMASATAVSSTAEDTAVLLTRCGRIGKKADANGISSSDQIESFRGMLLSSDVSYLVVWASWPWALVTDRGDGGKHRLCVCESKALFWFALSFLSFASTSFFLMLLVHLGLPSNTNDQKRTVDIKTVFAKVVSGSRQSVKGSQPRSKRATHATQNLFDYYQQSLCKYFQSCAHPKACPWSLPQIKTAVV